MAKLVQLSTLSGLQDAQGNTVYDPTGDPAYAGSEKVGTVYGALTDETSGRLRYLILDVGNWFSAKHVIVPVGMARFENDGVYFDSLTKMQVKAMGTYSPGMDVTDDFEYTNEAALTGQPSRSAGQAYDYAATKGTQGYFDTPQKLQLLEERLVVDKQRTKVGAVEVGKRVETREEKVDVTLARDEVIIERRAVSDPRPVDGAVVLGADTAAIRVDLEAERADVRKQAYVTEEVEVSKRTDTETKTFTETVGKEVLEVEKTGEVRVNEPMDNATNKR
jgi:uncharacterized protein (TIGR02271 family)